MQAGNYFISCQSVFTSKCVCIRVCMTLPGRIARICTQEIIAENCNYVDRKLFHFLSISIYIRVCVCACVYSTSWADCEDMYTGRNCEKSQSVYRKLFHVARNCNYVWFNVYIIARNRKHVARNCNYVARNCNYVWFNVYIIARNCNYVARNFNYVQWNCSLYVYNYDTELFPVNKYIHQRVCVCVCVWRALGGLRGYVYRK